MHYPSPVPYSRSLYQHILLESAENETFHALKTSRLSICHQCIKLQKEYSFPDALSHILAPDE